MRIARPFAIAPLPMHRPTLSPRTLAVLALVSANIIWGTTFVATKPVLERVPPLTLASARFAIALMVLLPILRLSGRRPMLTRATALMAFVGVFLVYACQNLGLMYTDASNGAIIHGGIPVITLLLAAPLLGERIDPRRASGIALSLIGVVAVVLRGDALGMSMLGDGLVLLSAVGLGAYLVLGRRAFPAGANLELVGGVAVFGFLYMVPASAVELATVGVDRPTTGDVLNLLYLGIAASGLAFVLWGYGLRHLEAGQAAAFANLNALVGVIVAATLLGETISPIQLAGGAMIITGVWLTSTRPAPRRIAIRRARRLPARSPA